MCRIATSIMICLGLLTGFAHANSKRTNPASPQVQSQLGLSDQQLQKIQEFRSSQKQVIESREKNFQDAQRAFRRALQNNANEDELKQRFDELQTARNALSQARFQQMLKLRGVLTDEQQRKFREMRGNLDDL